MTSQPSGELGQNEPSLMDIAAEMDEQPGEAVETEEDEGEEPESEIDGGEQSEEEESEEGEEPDEGQEQEDPEFVVGDSKVKLSELKAGYMKDADYRRKTSEVAETKRAAEALHQDTQKQREYFAKHTAPLLNLMREQLIGSQSELARLAQEDPAAWVSANQQYVQRAQMYEALMAESQVLEQQRALDEERAHAEWVKAQEAKLLDVVPEWRDAKRADQDRLLVAQYLIDNGYEQSDLTNLTDVRALRTALDAARWREHEKKVKAAQGKQAPAKPPAQTIKPGAAKVPATQQQRRIAEANKRLSSNPNDLRSLAALTGASGF